MGNAFSVWLKLKLLQSQLYAQWNYGINREGLLERELPAEVKKEAKISFLISPVIYAGAIIISFWLPVVSAIVFVITPVLYLIPNKLDKYLP